MSATVQFTGMARRRELTNVDLGAIKDLGWSVITSDPIEGPSIRLAISQNQAGQLVLNFDSEAGVIYRLQTSLDSCFWLDVTPYLTGQEGTTTWSIGDPSYTDPNMLSPAGASRYFRVIRD